MKVLLLKRNKHVDIYLSKLGTFLEQKYEHSRQIGRESHSKSTNIVEMLEGKAI
jgi:hypothetical protein